MIAASERNIEFHLLAQPARLAAGADLRLDVGSEAPLRPLVHSSGFSRECCRLDGSTSASVFLVTSALIERTSQVKYLYELMYIWIQSGSVQDAAAIPLRLLKERGSCVNKFSISQCLLLPPGVSGVKSTGDAANKSTRRYGARRKPEQRLSTNCPSTARRTTRLSTPVIASRRNIEFHPLAPPTCLVAGAKSRLDVGSGEPFLRPLVHLSGFSHKLSRLCCGEILSLPLPPRAYTYSLLNLISRLSSIELNPYVTGWLFKKDSHVSYHYVLINPSMLPRQVCNPHYADPQSPRPPYRTRRFSCPLSSDQPFQLTPLNRAKGEEAYAKQRILCRVALLSL